MIVGLSIVVLFVLLAAGISIAISLASSGIFGLLLLRGPDITGSVIAGTSYTAVASGALLVVPMFVLMGMFTLHSGIAEHLFAVASRVLKWLPGGLGIATVFSAAGFGAICGSSLATVATLGPTCITEMMRHGYKRSFASAIVAVSGTLAVLIPPSIILILYGVITGESIGTLLIAGIIPGIISAVVLGALIAVRAMRSETLISPANSQEFAVVQGHNASSVGTGVTGAEQSSSVAVMTMPDDQEHVGSRTENPSWVSVVYSVGGISVLFAIVIGGLYTGIFTPTESATVGAFAALILLFVSSGGRPRRFGVLVKESLFDTVSLNSMIFLILVGAGIFSFFLVSAGVPSALARAVVDLPLPPTAIVLLLLLFLVPLGMFLDSISLLVITVPLVYGPITALGFDGIWLGILVVKLIELGMVTPPVGMNAYVAAGTVRGLSIEEVFRGIVPFYLADFILVALFFIFPQVVTWLPNIMAG